MECMHTEHSASTLIKLANVEESAIFEGGKKRHATQTQQPKRQCFQIKLHACKAGRQ